jgi:hypothetical protein
MQRSPHDHVARDRSPSFSRKPESSEASAGYGENRRKHWAVNSRSMGKRKRAEHGCALASEDYGLRLNEAERAALVVCGRNSNPACTTGQENEVDQKVG